MVEYYIIFVSYTKEEICQSYKKKLKLYSTNKNQYLLLINDIVMNVLSVPHWLSFPGRSKLTLPPSSTVTVVLESDGTEVDDEDYFMCLDPNATFLLLTNGQKWSPAAGNTPLMCIPVENSAYD